MQIVQYSSQPGGSLKGASGYSYIHIEYIYIYIGTPKAGYFIPNLLAKAVGRELRLCIGSLVAPY
jgi:hypothetical protein